jgi:hypothetical protein
MDRNHLKKISIHQPNYLPWLGYFYKISQTDVFVFLDDVQFSNEGMHNYHYIKTSNGPFRLKIPVFQTLGDKICEVKVKNELNWREKHLRLLEENYQNADYFEQVYSDFKGLLDEGLQYLSALNTSIIKFICNKLGIKTTFINSSDLNVISNREAKIIDICNVLNCEIYYSGPGARAYQNEEHFLSRGVQLKYSDYKVFQYKQQFPGFQSNVSIIDFLMNCGYDWDYVIKHQTSL